MENDPDRLPVSLRPTYHKDENPDLPSVQTTQDPTEQHRIPQNNTGSHRTKSHPTGPHRTYRLTQRTPQIMTQDPLKNTHRTQQTHSGPCRRLNLQEFPPSASTSPSESYTAPSNINRLSLTTPRHCPFRHQDTVPYNTKTLSLPTSTDTVPYNTKTLPLPTSTDTAPSNINTHYTAPPNINRHCPFQHQQPLPTSTDTAPSNINRLSLTTPRHCPFRHQDTVPYNTKTLSLPTSTDTVPYNTKTLPLPTSTDTVPYNTAVTPTVLPPSKPPLLPLPTRCYFQHHFHRPASITAATLLSFLTLLVWLSLTVVLPYSDSPLQWLSLTVVLPYSGSPLQWILPYSGFSLTVDLPYSGSPLHDSPGPPSLYDHNSPSQLLTCF
ncbi:mucin-2-like [Penaeus indicus]|uniref:mucin-2-like n=1 Tax=Penaeus indicus TaxID=29960 RepID=UPI00300C1D8F